MLAAYPEFFGHKAISGVKIFYHGNRPDMCWLLEQKDKPISPMPALPASPLSKKQMRQHKKKLSQGSTSTVGP
jgi:hypothetical protein